MKIVEHKNMQIEDFQQFYAYLHKQHPEILGVEWDKETKVLKVFYQDGSTELSEDDLKTLKIPTVLRFRKKVAPPKLDSATVSISATENEITVETFDADAVRKEVKKNLAQFEEV
jgi:hypothetical protein